MTLHMRPACALHLHMAARKATAILGPLLRARVGLLPAWDRGGGLATRPGRGPRQGPLYAQREQGALWAPACLSLVYIYMQLLPALCIRAHAPLVMTSAFDTSVFYRHRGCCMGVNCPRKSLPILNTGFGRPEGERHQGSAGAANSGRGIKDDQVTFPNAAGQRRPAQERHTTPSRTGV